MTTIEIPKVFKPLDEPYRYKVMYGGRGSSKSWSVARKLILRSIENKILILCTRELQKSIKQSVHRLIKNQIEFMGLSKAFSFTDHSIKCVLNDSEFIFLGTRHNPEEIKSTEGIDICWIEEAANVTEDSWDIIDPTIRKEGSEIWVTFNTRFKFDHMFQFFTANPPKNAWVKRVNHDDNPFFPSALKEQMEKMKVDDYEKYLYIWEGQLKQLAKGAIFGKQMIQMRKDKRICKVPVLSGVEVHTFWDLGRNDHTAIWFMQNVGKEYRIIDYYEGRLQDIDHYCRVIKGSCTEIERDTLKISKADNERRQAYLYGQHHMPHDVKHQMLGMKTSRIKQFESGGVKPVKVVPRIALKNEAIELARTLMPSVWIDEDRCERGIDCLSNYRYEYNDDRDTHNQTPHHDWSSNGADAFMGMAQGFKPGGNDADWDDLEYDDIEVA